MLDLLKSVLTACSKYSIIAFALICVCVPLALQVKNFDEGGLAYHDHQKFVLNARNFEQFRDKFLEDHLKAREILGTAEERGYVFTDDRQEAERISREARNDREFKQAGGVFHSFWRRGAIYSNIVLLGLADATAIFVKPIVSYQFWSIVLGGLSLAGALMLSRPTLGGRILTKPDFFLILSSAVLVTSPAYMFLVTNPMGEFAFLVGGLGGVAIFIWAAEKTFKHQAWPVLLAICSGCLMFLSFTARPDGAVLFPGIATLYLLLSRIKSGRTRLDSLPDIIALFRSQEGLVVSVTALIMVVLYVSEALFYNFWITPTSFSETLGVHARVQWPYKNPELQSHTAHIARLGWLPILAVLAFNARKSKWALLLCVISCWPVLLTFDMIARDLLTEVRFYASTAIPILIGFILANRLIYIGQQNDSVSRPVTGPTDNPSNTG